MSTLSSPHQRPESPRGTTERDCRPTSNEAPFQERMTCILLNYVQQQDLQPQLPPRVQEIIDEAHGVRSFLNEETIPRDSPRLIPCHLDHIPLLNAIQLSLCLEKRWVPTQQDLRYIVVASAWPVGVDNVMLKGHKKETLWFELQKHQTIWFEPQKHLPFDIRSALKEALRVMRLLAKTHYDSCGCRRSNDESRRVKDELRHLW